MHIEVPALRYRDLIQGGESEASAVIRERVKEARKRQEHRLGKGRSNSQMSARELKVHCPLSSECQEVIRQAVDVMGMSARACDRLLRVAMTIADMERSEEIRKEHLMEAMGYRQ